MYYTLIHLPTATEIREQYSYYISNKRAPPNLRIKTFHNIRQARDYINRNTFIMHEDSVLAISDTYWISPERVIAKHFIEPVRHEGDV